MHFDKPTYSVRRTKKKNIPEGLWVKCPSSGESVFKKELEDNQMVVPKSGYHFPIGARERIAFLVDPGTFEEKDAKVRSADPLGFVDAQPYTTRLKRYEKDSGLPEAVICGVGRIHGIEVTLAVMDFRFCGGTLGSATGEKITRAIEFSAPTETTPRALRNSSQRPPSATRCQRACDGTRPRLLRSTTSHTPACWSRPSKRA